MNNKLLILLFLCIFSVMALQAVIEETESLKNFLYDEAPGCEYDNWMSHLVEGLAAPGYNVYAPWDRQTNGFGNYQIPTNDDLANWQEIITDFLAGDLTAAQSTIDNAGYPYQVVIFHDTDSDRIFHMLRELPNFDYYDDNGTDDPGDDEHGAFDYGWGLYIHYPSAPYPHITTAPHPNDDFISVPIAHQVFIDHQSKFLFISGAGREVVWTNIGSYDNSKSISDPSRRESHVFNVSYQNACDLIRSQFESHEFSLQVHSFDWGQSHWGYPDVQISGGFYVSSPDLPIRDFSEARIDIVNFSSEYIHPANEVGIHDPVHLNDFYGFHCSQYDFTFSNADTTFAVNTNTDLWGYSSNRQIVYTSSGMNHYDNFERFFHVEVDELPNVYPQIVANYHWFHGWDAVSQTWNMADRFSRSLVYYAPFIDALTEVLPDVFQMNDNTVPLAPSALQAVSECSDHIKLVWQPGECFDLETYQILYGSQPLSSGNYQIIDSADQARLACLAQDNYTLTNLNAGELYYFAVRIKDKNGNLSDLSNEIFAITGPAALDDFVAFGRDERIFLEWSASSGSGFLGFNVYRRTSESDWEMIDSWVSNPALSGQTGSGLDYQYMDDAVENGVIYTYQLRVEQDGYEYHYGTQRSAEARQILALIASLSNTALSDTTYFGSNVFASNGFDPLFDIPADTSAVGQYLLTQFYEQYWQSNPNQLQQEIYALYDPVNSWRSWTYRLRTNQLNQPIEIGLANADRNAERIYLYRDGVFVDLTTDNFLFTATSSNNYYSFTLYYGNLVPSLEFASRSNRLFYPYEVFNIGWEVNLHPLIAQINIFATNDEITIPIASDLPPQSTSLNWQIPNLLWEDLRIRIDLVMQEGDTLSYYSPYRFGIISPQISVQTQSGWQLISQNFDPENYTPEDIYGSGIEFYDWQDEFVLIPQPEFLHPYWLWAPQSNYASLSSVQMQRTACSYPLLQGWNIIPNPHRASYLPQQLIFKINNQDLEYYQALQFQLIEPVIFAYDSGFAGSPDLKAGAAYYLYCHQPGMEVKFIPYYSNHYSPQFSFEWLLALQAEQAGYTSGILAGTSSGADADFNPNYDQLKPQLLPFSELSFYLPLQVSGSQNPLNLHRSITAPQPAAGQILFEWEAELTLPHLEPVNFSINTSDLPSDYLVYLQLPDLLMDVSANPSFEYFPSDSLLNCLLLISDELLLKADEMIVPANLSTGNYPNPFNPETTIWFNLPETSEVRLEIYNIKGQKVRNLLQQEMPSGQHSIIWNGKDDGGKEAASGVYFYKLIAGERPAILEKMLMIK